MTSFARATTNHYEKVDNPAREWVTPPVPAAAQGSASSSFVEVPNALIPAWIGMPLSIVTTLSSITMYVYVVGRLFTLSYEEEFGDMDFAILGWLLVSVAALDMSRLALYVCKPEWRF